MNQALREHRMGKHRGKRYRTVQDIVIPAGTEVGQAPSRTVRFTNHVDAGLAHGPDMSSTWTMDEAEALEAGLIERIDA
jgi:hypothetical protein